MFVRFVVFNVHVEFDVHFYFSEQLKTSDIIYNK